MNKWQRRYEGYKKALRLKRLRKAQGVRNIDWYTWERRTRQCRTPCSCTMCGNPRRHFNKPAIQEQKADEALQAQLNDLTGAANE